MKYLLLLFSISVLLLVSCSTPIPQVLATVEVTRIVQITTTSIPTNTLSPTPTPNQLEVSGTHVANTIGTPIKAPFCYKATDRQGEINNCSNARRIELESQMNGLINKLREKYDRVPEEQNTFLQFQAEWENFVIRECEFRSGRNAIYSGSMALTNYNECLVGKYEDRLHELQIQLYEFSI